MKLNLPRAQEINPTIVQSHAECILRKQDTESVWESLIYMYDVHLNTQKCARWNLKGIFYFVLFILNLIQNLKGTFYFIPFTDLTVNNILKDERVLQDFLVENTALRQSEARDITYATFNLEEVKRNSLMMIITHSTSVMYIEVYSPRREASAPSSAD